MVAPSAVEGSVWIKPIVIEGWKCRCNDSVFAHLDFSIGGDKKQGGPESEKESGERWTVCSLKQLTNDLQEFTTDKFTQRSQWAETRNRGWITTPMFVSDFWMSKEQN